MSSHLVAETPTNVDVEKSKRIIANAFQCQLPPTLNANQHDLTLSLRRSSGQLPGYN